MVDAQNHVYYYLNDHLGSAAVVIDSAGNVKDKYKYRPFGGEHQHTMVLGQAYRYTGKPLDEEDGWLRYRCPNACVGLRLLVR